MALTAVHQVHACPVLASPPYRSNSSNGQRYAQGSADASNTCAAHSLQALCYITDAEDMTSRANVGYDVQRGGCTAP